MRGSFRHDIAGFECTDCDCGDPCSNWVDGFQCYPAFGPDDNEQRWGSGQASGFNCFSQSGIGFKGETAIPMTANDPTDIKIGFMTHYNNVISPPTPTKLQLYIKLTAPELGQAFETIFPMSFIETTNRATVAVCDPSIQRFDVPCDDRFSFDAYAITKSFVAPNNVRYTLQITGFIQDAVGATEPLAQFVTKEKAVTRANVFARIVTFCEAKECKPNEVFEGSPKCDCTCILSNKTCKGIWPTSVVDDETCQCACGETSESLGCNATNPAIGAFNEESCTCGCALTNAICKAQNNRYEVSLGAVPCKCVCARQYYIDCKATNAFFVPAGEKCGCVCGVTDELCQALFEGQKNAKKYRADKDKCGCFIPGGDTGLTDEEIAGIVIATVLGPLILIGLVVLLAALLAYLILAGYIPGIYGYSIAQGSFAAGGNSSLYADPWQNNSNATA